MSKEYEYDVSKIEKLGEKEGSWIKLYTKGDDGKERKIIVKDPIAIASFLSGPGRYAIAREHKGQMYEGRKVYDVVFARHIGATSDPQKVQAPVSIAVPGVVAQKERADKSNLDANILYQNRNISAQVCAKVVGEIVAAEIVAGNHKIKEELAGDVVIEKLDVLGVEDHAARLLRTLIYEIKHDMDSIFSKKEENIEEL